jgi:hypothetical protein
MKLEILDQTLSCKCNKEARLMHPMTGCFCFFYEGDQSWDTGDYPIPLLAMIVVFGLQYLYHFLAVSNQNCNLHSPPEVLIKFYLTHFLIAITYM